MALIDVAVILAGLLIGVFVGLTSIGTGTIGIPVLLLLGVPPAAAVGANLVQATIIKAFGAFVHFKKNRVVVPVAIDFVLLGIPAAFAGSFAGKFIDPSIFQILLAAVLVLSSLGIIIELLFGKKSTHCSKCFFTSKFSLNLGSRAATIFFGGLIGFTAGLTSIGSGSLIILALLLFLRIPASCAVGTSVFAGFLILAAGAAFQIFSGSVDFSLTASLLLGSIPGVYLGSHLCSRAPNPIVKTVVAALVLIAGLEALIQ